jgi:hypothetical protein
MARKFYIQPVLVAPSIVFENFPPVGYTEVIDTAVLKALHIKQYKARKIAGQEYVVAYTAQLYLDILSGDVTPTQVFLFEQHVNDLLRQVDGGHWFTAQATNANLALSGIYDQTRKDQIQADLDAEVYIRY